MSTPRIDIAKEIISQGEERTQNKILRTGAGKMVQCVKTIAAKTDDLSLMPGEN